MEYNVLDTDELIKQFLSCTPINIINGTILKEGVTDLNSQKRILESTVNSDLIKQYPNKHSYQKAFLKWFMNKIEVGGGEVHDDMYTTYCNLISLNSDEPTHYRHFLIEQGSLDCITIQESTNIISEGTTGLCSWQAAAALSRWCAENRASFYRKTVLELGCGVGLTGLNVISVCSPKEYIFSDCHHAVLAMVSKNVKLNLLKSKDKAFSETMSASDRLKLQVSYYNTIVNVMDLSWEEIGTYVSESQTIPDVIIAADILFEKNSFHALASGLKILLSFENRYAIIAATIRNEDTISHFLEELGKHNLDFEECTLPEHTVHVQLAVLPIRIIKIYYKR